MKKNIRQAIIILFAMVLMCTNVQWVRANAMSARTSENLDPETMEWVEEAGEQLTKIAEEQEIRALIYLADSLPIREVPKEVGAAVVTVLSGQPAYILDTYVDDAYEIWMYVRVEVKGQEYYGYVPEKNLACSDSRYIEWQEYYGFSGRSAYAIDEQGNTVYEDIEQFPESYRPALLALKEKHPNWTFAKLNTTLDWDSVVTEQLKNGKSLVYKTLPAWAKEGLYDNGTWYYASEAALELYLDPRNALHEDAIFQFEELTYNKNYHTKSALRELLNNTFMNDGTDAPGTVMTFVDIFWSLATEESVRNISPYHLAARVIQEQGRQGGSQLISGTYSGYEGWYNYFNIGATGKTDAEVILNGMKYAKANWGQGAYYCIMFGADFIAGNYIERGQNTLYLQKYNVNPNGYYAVNTHQYMQNISAPTTEAQNIKKLYEESGALDSPFVFSIPVYENMPAEPCAEPVVSTSVVLDLPEGYTDTTMWLDGVAYQGEIRNDKLVATAADGNAKTAVVYQYTEKGKPTGMYVWELTYDGMTYTATPLPGLENLLTYEGFSIRTSGNPGMRFRTGISINTRRQLINTGINGYTLKEYGSILMPERLRTEYPFTLNGGKIVKGMAYGVDANGNKKDMAYKILADSYHFSVVLVNIKEKNYKTDYAFRGYAVLEKDGVEIPVYGPIIARNIYDMAKAVLDAGSLAPGTDGYEYLKNLVADADALEQPTVSGGDAAAGGTATPTVSGGNAAE